MFEHATYHSNRRTACPEQCNLLAGLSLYHLLPSNIQVAPLCWTEPQGLNFYNYLFNDVICLVVLFIVLHGFKAIHFHTSHSRLRPSVLSAQVGQRRRTMALWSLVRMERKAPQKKTAVWQCPIPSPQNTCLTESYGTRGLEHEIHTRFACGCSLGQVDRPPA